MSKRAKRDGIENRKGILYVRIYPPGNPDGIRKSTRIRADDQNAYVRAEELRREWEAAYSRASAAVQSGNIYGAEGPLAHLASEDYKDGQASELNAGTLGGRRSAHKHLIAFFGARSLGAITYDVIRAYQTSRREAGASWETIRRERIVLRRLLRNGVEKGWLLRLPHKWPSLGRHVKNQKRTGHRIPDNVFQAWLTHLETDAFEVAVFLGCTGLRLAELGRIEESMVAPYSGELQAHGVSYKLQLRDETTKTHDGREIPLLPEAVAVLQDRLQRVGAIPFAGVYERRWSYYEAWRKAQETIGYSRTIHPRSLRHTVGSKLAEKDPVAAMRILGHKDLRTTERYTHTTQEKAISAISGLHRHSLTGTVSSKSGRGGEIRTPDPLTPSPEQLLAQHVSACKDCAAVVLAHLSNPLFGTPNRHSEPAFDWEKKQLQFRFMLAD